MSVAYFEYQVAESARKLLRAEERGLVRSAPMTYWQRRDRFREGKIDGGVLMAEMDLQLRRHVAWLLGQRLRGCDGWPAGNWIDDIVTIGEIAWSGVKTRESTGTLAGLAIWSDLDARREWVEPFLGTIRVDPGVRGHVSYDLRFADATTELGLVRYDRRLLHDWGSALPSRWRFTFTKVSR